ncbi:hypothetical protein ACHAWF_018743 [Thalassiosira exigua]
MKYFKLDCASLPDELFTKQTDVKEWLKLATSVEGKFPPGSLNKVLPIERDVEMERIFGISAWMAGNVMPFAVSGLLVLSLISHVAAILLKVFLAYYGILYAVNKFYFWPKFTKKYEQAGFSSDIRENQYLFTERNNQKYTSMQIVWPESLRSALENQPAIFCAVPHGLAPLGITCYPIWSKLFNNILCRWTCAPIVLKIPIISKFMSAIGYIPAKSKNIVETLTKKEENVGIILDGIAGMFQGHDEVAHIQKRKGIVKIALRAGVPIVPVYGFGHTSLWKVVVDPFGIMEKISIALDVSVCPFFGRFGWFLGPPQRTPLCVVLGEPVRCPNIDNPVQADIDNYHGKMLKSYGQLFEHHKEAYGWGDKELKFV